MKTIIAGSRSLTWYDLEQCLRDYRLPITEIVCGCAKGVDRCGESYARDIGAPVTFFPAWADQYYWALNTKRPGESLIHPKGGYSGGSRSFGYQRNRAMAQYSDAAICIWDGGSPGTNSMITLAQEMGLALHVYRVQMKQHRLEGIRE